MLFHQFLKRFIKVGTLNVIDSKGRTYRCSATSEPEVTIRFHTKRLEWRLCYKPVLALGEGYMSGELTVEKGDIYDFLSLCAMNFNQVNFSPLDSVSDYLSPIKRLFHHHNPIGKSTRNVAHHYDLSEDLYRLFLDSDMQYSCAYFTSLEDELETAQEQKKHHIAAKLQLIPGHKVLDIGSGWGGLAITLAKDLGVDVTGLTLSEEQYRVAMARVKKEGLTDRVRFYLRDYREEKETYDRIVSVGMFEHVGVRHFSEFFSQVQSLLKEDGVALLHSIGDSMGPSKPNPWLSKYIFPGGYCPALSETLGAIESAKLHVTDIEILHRHYAETLRHWRKKFLAQHELVKKKWGETFFRMWEYYLACCEVAFRKRGYMVFQIQMVKNPEHAHLTRDYMREEEQRLKAFSQVEIPFSQRRFAKTIRKSRVAAKG